MEKSYDVLVVGGGIAGLTGAAYLSRSGCKVALCEKNATIGGLANSFCRDGFTLDSGIRAFENAGTVLPMLRQLGLPIEFVPDPVYVGVQDQVLLMNEPDSLTRYQALLTDCFPQEESAIQVIMQEINQAIRYMKVLYEVDNPLFSHDKTDAKYNVTVLLPWLFRYLGTMGKIDKLQMPIEQYLLRFTQNQALIDVITQHFFRGTPAFFALSYFGQYNGYLYPKGGTGKVPEEMMAFIKNYGGEIFLESQIAEFVTPHQAMDQKGNAYSFKNLLWAADSKRLYDLYPKDQLSKKERKRFSLKYKSIKETAGGDSIFSCYLLLDADEHYLRQRAGGHIFYTPEIKGQSSVSLAAIRDTDGNYTKDKNRLMDWVKQYFHFTTYEIASPGLHDSSLTPPGKSALLVSCLFDYSLTRHLADVGLYEDFKALGQSLIPQILEEKLYPQLTTKLKTCFTATPLTIERFSGNSGGAITGWDMTASELPAVHKMIKVAQAVKTPFPQVFQAGQWTFSPSGFPISILTGKLAADKIIKALK